MQFKNESFFGVLDSTFSDLIEQGLCHLPNVDNVEQCFSTRVPETPESRGLRKPLKYAYLVKLRKTCDFFFRQKPVGFCHVT